jgi:TupA-like ATPgrasp
MNVRAAILSAIYKLPTGVRRRALFVSSHRRMPHFRKPLTFSDKVNWRILNDRRPLLEWTCDKLAMKDHARHVPELHIPDTLWAGTDLQELASARLPEHWTLKPNHRTGLVYFGHGQPDIEQLSAVTGSWLRRVEAEKLREWAYSKARPMFLAEEVLGTPGSAPPDYKFYVFDGDVAVIEVIYRPTSNHRLYLPDWSPLTVRWGYDLAPVQPPPAGLDRMLAAAAALGSGFDFIRIDLYNIGGKVYFGEFTPYPGSGLCPTIPASFDTELGARWTLPRRRRLKNSSVFDGWVPGFCRNTPNR